MKIIKLKEQHLTKLIKRIISEQNHDDGENNFSDLERIESKIIKYLNEADNRLNADDFSRLAESIIDYIDEIGRSKM
jgi:hypothetical protein